jgi:hypothetical protein
VRGTLRLPLIGLVAVTLAACEREELVSVDPKEAPGRSAATVETLLNAGLLAGWKDTVFFGFSNPAGASFMLAEAGSPRLSGRVLLRFNAPVQDSVFRRDTVSAALGFDSLRLILALDTARSRLSSAGTTVQVYSVEDEWDHRSATWELAVDSPGVSVAWTAGPGGSLGRLLSEVVLTEKPDTVVFDLAAFSDSLLRLWNDTTRVNTGLAVIVADSGRLVLGLPRVQYNIIPQVQPDTALEVRCPSLSSLVFCFPNRTYIFDRSAVPPAVGLLRVGGVEGWRAFSELILPDSVPVEGSSERALLRDAIINKAELLLRSLGPPAAPFGSEARFDATAFELVGDFTLLGAKTPVGNEVIGARFSVEPDSLAAGATVSVDLTGLVQRWALAPADSAPAIRFAIRARPEGTTFGYWEFGAADGDPAFAPTLRIVFTPATEFPFP